MKKLILGCLFSLIVSLGVGALDSTDMFVKTLPITKVYTHRLGFKIVYLKSDLSLGNAYVPISWFDETGGKGLLIKGTNSSFPYFSIFWSEGTFHSIKMYVHKDLSHPTWGRLDPSMDLSSEFALDALELDF